MKFFFNRTSGKVCTILLATSLSIISIGFVIPSGDDESNKAFITAFSLAPASLICLYGGFACRYVRSRKLEQDSVGNFTYFLGYLCTITALTVLVARLGDMEDGFLNIRTITVAISVALTTTIVGLVFMTLIKSERAIDTETTSEIVARLEGVISSNKNAFNNLYQECNRTTDSLVQMRGNAEGFTQTIENFNSTIDQNKEKFNQCAEDMTTCMVKIDNLLGSLKKISEHKLPDNVLNVLGEMIKGVHELDQKCTTAGKSVENFSTSVETCSGTISSMRDITSTNVEEMEQFNGAVEELDKVLHQFAKLMRLLIRKRGKPNSR